MRAVLTWLLVAGILAFANVVAAGVMMILGGLVNKVSPDAMHELVWPWFIVGLLGVLAAILFLRGAMLEARPWRRYLPVSTGKHEGLESGLRQRLW